MADVYYLTCEQFATLERDLEKIKENTQTIIADRDALRAEVARLREALEWYAQQLKHVRKNHSEGDTARAALSDDRGSRARAALAQQGEAGE
jgi:regulator of replication initiation timing